MLAERHEEVIVAFGNFASS